MEMVKIPSVALYVLDLVLNSLHEHSSCIAIRIYKEKNELQVVDNGIGISVNELADIEDAIKNNAPDLRPHYNLRNTTLMNICKHFSIVVISSRSHSSMETHTKIYKKGLYPNLLKVLPRPSSGTTVTLCNYLEGIHDHEQNISIICFLIASISLNNPKISYSVRNEHDIFLKITKEYNPREVLKLLYKERTLHDFIWDIACTTVLSIQYHGYFGLIKNQENAVHYIFLNNRPVYCSTIINTILDYFIQNLSLHLETYNVTKEMIFLIFFINCPSTEFVVTTRNDKRFVLLYKVRDILDSIRHYINNIFLNEFFLEKLCEYIQYHMPKQVQKINKTMEFQKVHDILPLFFYELDFFHKNHKTKKSILYNTNINHNPITVFCTKYGMNIYESKREKSSEGNYIIDMLCNIPHVKTKQNIIFNQDQHCFEKDNLANISNNFTRYFSLQENIEHANCVNETSMNIMINQDTNFLTKEEYIELEKNLDQLEKSQELHIPKYNSYVKDYSCSLSEWSDWSYHSNLANNCTISKLKRTCENIEKYTFFDFLPQKLNNLLKFKSIKLTEAPSLNSIDKNVFSIELSYNYQENVEQYRNIDIHPCASVQHCCEFRLNKTALKFIKILNQVNNQLIAALINYDKIKLLLMMDQHAVHERIRYERLLNDYKTPDHASFLSKKLSIPIAIEVTINTCTILLCNKMLLHKFGIILSTINENTICIYSVPKCFIKSKHCCNNEKLIMAIRNLLNEIVDNIINKKGMNILPLSIHNAISMEACHGAIKFGDSLSRKECIKLLNDLKNTKSPTRCAHGRPSIIPIIELSELRRKYYKNMEVTI
ncbi:hypothetical protein KPH14_007734 [Odynerus spinipes]|uniref:MutL C-terminal dimerisation domain-containing protein n=1 Tax=Odynerus spinipes TaxID=1348599 RepID=A0AAD9VNV5_9HYME|nr:hypothetical protein KPH14_007734 [Odynerus spinipes]